MHNQHVINQTSNYMFKTAYTIRGEEMGRRWRK